MANSALGWCTKFVLHALQTAQVMYNQLVAFKKVGRRRQISSGAVPCIEDVGGTEYSDPA